jgi:hypothetical protein
MSQTQDNNKKFINKSLRISTYSHMAECTDKKTACEFTIRLWFHINKNMSNKFNKVHAGTRTIHMHHEHDFLYLRFWFHLTKREPTCLTKYKLVQELTTCK